MSASMMVMRRTPTGVWGQTKGTRQSMKKKDKSID